MHPGYLPTLGHEPNISVGPFWRALISHLDLCN